MIVTTVRHKASRGRGHLSSQRDSIPATAVDRMGVSEQGRWPQFLGAPATTLCTPWQPYVETLAAALGSGIMRIVRYDVYIGEATWESAHVAIKAPVYNQVNVHTRASFVKELLKGALPVLAVWLVTWRNSTLRLDYLSSVALAATTGCLILNICGAWAVLAATPQTLVAPQTFTLQTYEELMPGLLANYRDVVMSSRWNSNVEYFRRLLKNEAVASIYVFWLVAAFASAKSAGKIPRPPIAEPAPARRGTALEEAEEAEEAIAATPPESTDIRTHTTLTKQPVGPWQRAIENLLAVLLAAPQLDDVFFTDAKGPANRELVGALRLLAEMKEGVLRDLSDGAIRRLCPADQWGRILKQLKGLRSTNKDCLLRYIEGDRIKNLLTKFETIFTGHHCGAVESESGQ